LVEGQHVISTMDLVDSLAEQQRLEELIDSTKPPVPPECRHLDPLLFTPFRYPARHNGRFRRKGQAEGVFYAAEKVETAVAEIAFYRALFFAESPGTPFPAKFSPFTAFSAAVSTTALVDIYGTHDPKLTHLQEYAATQAMADVARAVGAEGIRARSVRCPQQGATLSWLTCRVFTKSTPVAMQTWHMRVVLTGVQAICESPSLRIEFSGKDFAVDTRLAPLGW
jgi:hypothetical protein